MKLEGKKALITEGNSGIGFATARLFIREGAEVAITGRDQKTLDAAAAALDSKAVANKISQRFGGLDDDSSHVHSVELFVDGGNVGVPNCGASFRSASIFCPI